MIPVFFAVTLLAYFILGLTRALLFGVVALLVFGIGKLILGLWSFVLSHQYRVTHVDQLSAGDDLVAGFLFTFASYPYRPTLAVAAGVSSLLAFWIFRVGERELDRR